MITRKKTMSDCQCSVSNNKQHIRRRLLQTITVCNSCTLLLISWTGSCSFTRWQSETDRAAFPLDRFIHAANTQTKATRIQSRMQTHDLMRASYVYAAYQLLLLLLSATRVDNVNWLVHFFVPISTQNRNTCYCNWVKIDVYYTS